MGVPEFEDEAFAVDMEALRRNSYRTRLVSIAKWLLVAVVLTGTILFTLNKFPICGKHFSVTENSSDIDIGSTMMASDFDDPLESSSLDTATLGWSLMGYHIRACQDPAPPPLQIAGVTGKDCVNVQSKTRIDYITWASKGMKLCTYSRKDCNPKESEKHVFTQNVKCASAIVQSYKVKADFAAC